VGPSATARVPVTAVPAVARPGEPVVRSVAVGQWSTCATLEDGSVWCWGDDHSGTSEAGRRQFSQVPLRGIRKVLGAGERFVAVTEDGALFYWGLQPLDGDQTRGPQPRAAPLGPVSDVALTFDNLCALERTGRLSCWNGEGVATPPLSLPNARALSLSIELGCALMADGTVSCWHDDQPPRPRAGLSEVLELVAGANRHCARHRSGKVSCWSKEGDDAALARQLGPTADHLSATPHALCSFGARGLQRCVQLDTGSSRAQPLTAPSQELPAGARISSVAFGPEHACAVADGAVWCWGEDVTGELGGADVLTRGPRRQQVSLGDTASLRHVRSVGVSDQHHCVALDDGTMRCWGNNEHGQLGIPAGTNQLGPTAVPGISQVAHVVVSDDTTCAIKTDGSLICWGALPLVASDVAEAGLGGRYGCLRTPQGRVRCWGENSVGELGTGDGKPHAEPTPVLLQSRQELSDVTRLRVFNGHACALTGSHRLYCWGGNQPFEQGRPYNGPDHFDVATELKVAGGVRDVSDTCLLTEGGDLRCWGSLLGAEAAFSYEPQRVGQCAVTALSNGPGACFADADGWACLALGDTAERGTELSYLKLATASLTGVTGSTEELCGIEANGALACFRSDGYAVRPAIGQVQVSAFSEPPLRKECPGDPPPRQLPKFPRLPAARVTAQPSAGWMHADQLSPTVPGVALSKPQVTRLLALLNDRSNYTNVATCHDATYFFVFQDRSGAEQARVGVGACGTLEASPEIPAQQGMGNVITDKLRIGLHRLCHELGLAVCREP